MSVYLSLYRSALTLINGFCMLLLTYLRLSSPLFLIYQLINFLSNEPYIFPSLLSFSIFLYLIKAFAHLSIYLQKVGSLLALPIQLKSDKKHNEASKRFKNLSQFHRGDLKCRLRPQRDNTSLSLPGSCDVI